jgi:serine/threonine protein phosphatase PrpC
MEVKSFSHNGVGKINEDYLAYRRLSDGCAVAVLADGMGGRSHSDLAARIVVDTILQTIEEQVTTLSPEELLPYAILKANEAIKVKSAELHCKMGAAVAVLLTIGDKAYFSWLGNVRIYLTNSHELRQLTSDHIYSTDTTGEPDGMFLTRCINGREFRDASPFHFINLIPSTRIFLCTDGFYQNLTPENMLEFGADAARLITDAQDDFSVIEVNC